VRLIKMPGIEYKMEVLRGLEALANKIIEPDDGVSFGLYFSERKKEASFIIGRSNDLYKYVSSSFEMPLFNLTVERILDTLLSIASHRPLEDYAKYDFEYLKEILEKTKNRIKLIDEIKRENGLNWRDIFVDNNH
jgi:hypothetical protein